ncbi:MAG: DNA methyltransferase [Nostoc sp.]|uniref:ParB/RepB/Spo0J family partition protein n=1 Tax=Nostoc sp. TaxID=1180 RepID=UPI002FF76950
MPRKQSNIQCHHQQVEELTYHPYIFLFPPLSPQEFQNLRADIAINGQGIAITVLKKTNEIIDGRHRYEVCKELGIKPKIDHVDLTEPQILWKVISLNIKRRHLSESQRAAIAADIANLQNGTNQYQTKVAPQICGATFSIKEAAEQLSVSTRTIESAKSIKSSFPEVWEYIRNGEVTVADAYQIRTEPEKIKQEVVRRFSLDKSTGKRIKKLVKYRKDVKQEIAKQIIEQAVNQILAMEISESPSVLFGDVWQLGNHTLTCCDSATWNAPQARLAIADPPYNAGMASWDIGFEWNHDWLIEKADLVIVTPGDESCSHFLRKTTMPYKCMIAHWIQNGMSKGPMGYGNHIIAAVFCKKSTPYKVTGIRNQNYSQSIIQAVDGDENDHPGRKPIDFVLTWIDRLTSKDDLIIDPFLGSGTTLMAAEQLGRICHGAELNPEYCATILGRWMSANREIPKKLKNLVDRAKKQL